VVQVPSCNSPSGAPVLYRSHSGHVVSTWCKFGRLCKSGNSCRFGHEIIERASSAHKSVRNVTLDIRQSIDSKAPSSSASLEAAENRNEGIAVGAPLRTNRKLEDAAECVPAKRQKCVDLRSDLNAMRVPMS
jgi:hypothetical protein